MKYSFLCIEKKLNDEEILAKVVRNYEINDDS